MLQGLFNKRPKTLTGDGQDRIIDYDHTYRYEDKIVFGAGIAGSDLQVTRPGTMW